MRWIALLACLGLASTASAQTEATHAWSHGTMLEGFVGVATTPTTMGSYGGAFGWELTHRFEMQAMGAWFPRSGGDEFAADMRMLWSLTPRKVIVPYITAGGGLYIGTFDRPDTETDPAAVIGAGVRFYARRQLSVRPEAAFRFVIDGSEVYRVTTFTIALTYHFDKEAVASAR